MGINKVRPSKPPKDKCPLKNEDATCQLQCKYNFFESDELTIDAYELKCLNCGWRETIGYRSDEMEDEAEEVNTKQCPFCELCDLAAGTNACDAKTSSAS